VLAQALRPGRRIPSAFTGTATFHSDADAEAWSLNNSASRT
jgi:hypothetical protein